jgi:protein-tyrosine phosphatase
MNLLLVTVFLAIFCPMKILFVCLGNICRSPLAEALLLHKIKEHGLEDKFQVNSCGTANYHIGEPPDQRTVKNAAKNGITIHHLGRQLTASDLREFDMILPMDSSNYLSVRELDTSSLYTNKIIMMREFDPQGKGQDVPDPWSGNEKDFQEVFEILNRSTDGLVKHLMLNFEC